VEPPLKVNITGLSSSNDVETLNKYINPDFVSDHYHAYYIYLSNRLI